MDRILECPNCHKNVTVDVARSQVQCPLCERWLDVLCGEGSAALRISARESSDQQAESSSGEDTLWGCIIAVVVAVIVWLLLADR